MSGKRKANDMSSSEPQEKLSKKARLKLARERAAQYAQRDKEKIESRRVKKSGVVRPKVNSKSKLAKNEGEDKLAETMTGRTTANKSPNKNLTLSDRKKRAMKNAKEFAARDRAGLETKKKVTEVAEAHPKRQQRESGPPANAEMEVVEHTQLPSNAVYTSQLPVIFPNHQHFGAAIDPNQVEAYERMRQMQYVTMQQQLVAQKHQKVNPTQQNLVVASEQNHLRTDQQDLQVISAAHHDLPGNHPMNMAILSQSVSTGRNSDSSMLPSGTVISDEKNEGNNNFIKEMNVEDMPPPPPALMAQVSQQVLLNAQKEHVHYLNSASIKDEGKNEEKYQVIVNDNSDVPHPDPIAENGKHLQAKKPKTRWLPKITSGIIIVVAAISSTILMLHVPSTGNTPSPDDTVIPKEPLCYFNSDSEYEEGCSNHSGGVQCPKGGVCEGGNLVDCDNIFQDVSDRGDKCVLGEKYFPMKDALMDQLLSHASQICDQSSKPSFKYTTLQKDQPTIPENESKDLMQVLEAEGFVVYDRDGLYVGLPEKYEVGLPLYCVLGNIGQWLLQEVGLLLLGILRLASSNLLGFVSTYPKLSVLNLLLLFCFVKYRKYRATKKKRQEDTIRTRKIAYRTLEESCGVEHCAIHIRDEIAMALYPNSKKLRLDLQRSVWPKIVDDVKRDTRVRKFQTLNKDGKARDMWQWTAASKTPSRG